MLRVTRRELTRAYRTNRLFCEDLTVSVRKLVALYCIECGLKALIMRDRRVESTDELPENAQIGHDLAAGLRLLRAPNSMLGITQLNVRTIHQRDPQQSLNAKQLHEAFRYGVPITMETEISAEIGKILGWLEGKLNDGI